MLCVAKFDEHFHWHWVCFSTRQNGVTAAAVGRRKGWVKLTR